MPKYLFYSIFFNAVFILKRLSGMKSNKTTSIVLRGLDFGGEFGGCEALVQLSIAFQGACVDLDCKVYIEQTPNYAKLWKKQYNKELIYDTKSLDLLTYGDIYIIPELVECPKLNPGVQLFVYILGAYVVCRNNDVQYISHNQYFASNYTFLHVPQVSGLKEMTISLTNDYIIHPYINRAIVHHAKNFSGLSIDGVMLRSKSLTAHKKKNLVLLDSDIPDILTKIIQDAVEISGGSYLKIIGLSRNQVLNAYEEGKRIYLCCCCYYF